MYCDLPHVAMVTKVVSFVDPVQTPHFASGTSKLIAELIAKMMLICPRNNPDKMCNHPMNAQNQEDICMGVCIGEITDLHNDR